MTVARSRARTAGSLQSAALRCMPMRAALTQAIGPAPVA
jgi:hypothetical protein